MNRKLRILLVDDHQIVRMGLATIIGQTPDLEVAGEARNGGEAMRQADALKPDVILMDLMMPNGNGVDATAAIVRAHPDTRILILTTFGSSGEVRRALEAGAAGAIVKDTPYDSILAAIRAAAKGEQVLSPEIAELLKAGEKTPTLSARQVEVLRLVADGLTTRQISQRLGIGPDGVNAHLRTVFSRLGAGSRTEAVTLALRNHLI